MEQVTAAAPQRLCPDYIEPRLQHILDRQQIRAKPGPYAAKTSDEVYAPLWAVSATRALFAAEGLRRVQISDLARLAGGASKEPLAFTLRHDDAAAPERLVLHMDPLEGIVETCQLREAQMLRAMQGVVPVPAVRFVDPEGQHLGQPGMVPPHAKAGSLSTDPVAVEADPLGCEMLWLLCRHGRFLA